jgi:hypothetical protein
VESSHHDAGRRHHAGGGISLQTLVIASIAAVVTSYTVSRVWGPGTLISAAATPVIVALVSEFLRRPVETVSATARRVPARRERAPLQVQDPARTGQPRPRRRAQPPPVDPGLIAAIEADERTARPARGPGPRWGLALATGAAAFAIVVGIYTVPDLVAGKSITGSGKATTFFGGSTSSKPKTKTVTEPAPTTVTTTAPATTTTVPQATSTATEPTAPATTTTTAPTTSVTPAPTTPAPTSTTSPPATTAPPPTTGTVPPVPGAP